MIRAPIHRLHMHIRLGAPSKAIEEVSQQLALKISHQAHLHLVIDDIGHPPTQVHRSHCQRLIHGHHKISGAHDALLISESLAKRFAQRDPHIFYSVMLIDIQIAGALQRQIETAVPSKQVQHVIEEPNPRRHLVNTLPIHNEFQRNLRLSRIPLHGSRTYTRRALSHYSNSRTSSPTSWPVDSITCCIFHPISSSDDCKAASPRVTCSSTPIVMRTNPAHPGSADLSRSSTPCVRISDTSSFFVGPIFISTKFAWQGKNGTPSVRRPSIIRSRPTRACSTYHVTYSSSATA